MCHVIKFTRVLVKLPTSASSRINKPLRRLLAADAGCQAKKRMTNRDIAMEYLRCFCAGDIDSLEPLLAANLAFTGTLHTYSSALEYLDSLRDDPPDECGYKVMSVTENEDSVAVFYQYQKLGHVMQIAQLFKIKDQKIYDVLLVFDGRGFT